MKPGLRILPSKTSCGSETDNVCSESSSNAVKRSILQIVKCYSTSSIYSITYLEYSTYYFNNMVSVWFQVGMVEFIGILIVKVIKGTNLAVRDVRSSDPYVVLTLGQQVSFNPFASHYQQIIFFQQVIMSIHNIFLHKVIWYYLSKG